MNAAAFNLSRGAGAVEEAEGPVFTYGPRDVIRSSCLIAIGAR